MGSVTLSYMPAIGEDNRLLWRAKRGHKRSAIATWFFHVAGGPDLQGKFPFNSPFLHQRLGLPKAETFRMIAQTAWRIARPRSPAAKRNPIYAMLLHQFDKNENDIVDVSEIGDAIRFLSVRGF